MTNWPTTSRPNPSEEMDFGIAMTRKRIQETEQPNPGEEQPFPIEPKEENDMSYSDRFKKAKAEGQAKDISFAIFKFEKTGDTLVGELVGFDKISIPNPSGEGTNEVYQYRIMTDAGPVSTVLGFSGDKAIVEGDVRNGDLLAITKTGTKELGSGRRVNLYNIEHIPQDR